MTQNDQTHLIQGFLLVREPQETEWKKIWFVLEEHQIVAFQDHKKKDTLYRIRLDHSSVNPDPTTPSYKQHCFEVVIKNSDETVCTYLFSATSRHNKEEWVENLLQQIYQGGSKNINGSARKSRRNTSSPQKIISSDASEPLKISFEDFPTVQFYNDVTPKLQESNSNSSTGYNSFYTKNILLTKEGSTSTSSLSSVESTGSSKSDSGEFGTNSNGGINAEKWGMVIAPFTTVQDILKSLAVKLDKEASSLTMVAKDVASSLELELQPDDKILNVHNSNTKLVIRNKSPTLVKSTSSGSQDSDKEHKESTKAKKIARNLRVKSQMFLSNTIMKSNSNESNSGESPKEGFGKKYLNFTAPRKKHDQRKTVALGNNAFETQNQTDSSSQDSPRSSSEDGVYLSNVEDEDDPDVLEWTAGELLAGETIVRRKRLLRVVPSALSVPGTLFITSFRIFFVDQNSPKQMTVSIPLGTINKISKNKKNPLIFQVSCRDMRIVAFEVAATQAKSSASEVIAIIHKYMPEDGEQTQLFAFNFKQNWGSDNLTGWELYDPITDYSRMKLPDTLWRLTDVNKSFELSPTYPNKLVVPASITDSELLKVGSFRSKGRIPVCVWVHPTNRTCLTRSSQPLVGVTRSKSSEDQKLLTEILATNPSPSSHILYISDARPKVNAQANQIKGMGYESPAVYTNCDIEFFNIANIHVMREAQKKLLKACQFFPFSIYNSQASLNEVGESSGWLEHIRRVLAAAIRVAELLDKECTSVLSHCSDGWDRTSQVVGITELLLDPFYRTIDGFAILIEKEFLSFGHKMQQRTGHAEDVVNVKEKERAPIFLQFIDCVWQIYQQYPTAFEFDSKYLIAILDHSYSCLFGTFLYNCYRERLETSLSSKTFSLWTFIHYNLSYFKNPKYTLVSEPIYPKIGVKNVNLWTEYYFRWKLSGIGNEFTPHDMKLINTTLTTIPIDNNNNNNNNTESSNANDNTTIGKQPKITKTAVRFADDHQLNDRIKSASDSEEIQEKAHKKKKKHHHHKKRAQSISE